MSEWKAFPMDQPWPKDRELVLATNMPGEDEGTLCYFSIEGYQQRHFMDKETGQPFGLVVCFWKPVPTTSRFKLSVVDNLSSLLTVLKAFFKGKQNESNRME